MIQANQTLEMSSIEVGPWNNLEKMDDRIRDAIQNLFQVYTEAEIFDCISTFQTFINKSQWNGNYDPQASFGLDFLKILLGCVASSSMEPSDTWEQEKRMFNWNGGMKVSKSNEKKGKIPQLDV
ncbi:hypothetical protein LIER_41129 [Lithospermum erythrorhizon]|uniref:Uncharacterized protein n=1 Tax=Lithospermum erythrorhizon TaxID=34254 RepID=A0AAV3R7T8_LITER